jgi:hypothetical protein
MQRRPPRGTGAEPRQLGQELDQAVDFRSDHGAQDKGIAAACTSWQIKFDGGRASRKGARPGTGEIPLSKGNLAA